ncbi:hypothetical protein [Azospirillum largimobile]
MLRISDRQQDQLYATRADAFHDRLRATATAMMAREAPEIPADEVAARIEAALAAAPTHGMETERQITRYVHILAAFPADHARREEFAWLGALLDGPGGADARLDQITAALTAAPRTAGGAR